MVGGDEADFAEAMPLFGAWAKNIILMGPAGSGQHTKAANQIAVAGATAAYTEALVYAQKAGLDPQKMLSAIGAGAAGSWQPTNMAPRVRWQAILHRAFHQALYQGYEDCGGKAARAV